MLRIRLGDCQQHEIESRHIYGIERADTMSAFHVLIQKQKDPSDVQKLNEYGKSLFWLSGVACYCESELF